MRTAVVTAGAVLAGIVFTGPLLAGPDRVTWPANFDTEYVLYNIVYNGQNQRLRMLYVNPEADAAARSGELAPNGTILVMVDRAAQLDANGLPILDENGMYVSEGEILGNVFVMEKQDGWGVTLGLDVVQNGDWDYATFTVDGTLRDNPTTGCFACHANRPQRDFNFTYFKTVEDRGS